MNISNYLMKFIGIAWEWSSAFNTIKNQMARYGRPKADDHNVCFLR